MLPSNAMRNIIFILSLLILSIGSFGQEPEKLSLLETDTTWQKEIFEFPIIFASQIRYTGFEDARFPKGWSDSTSNNFWSYAFAWKIEDAVDLTAKDLERDLKIYFDGLMGKENTMTLFLEKDAGKQKTSYIGKVHTFDNFRKKQMMTLNVKVEKIFCEEQKKRIILFRFSPKEFDHKVWLKLNEARLPVNICGL